MKTLLILIFIGFISASNLHATTITVPIDQNTIQAGIDSATSGDTVLVQPGTYIENINFSGKNIVVGSMLLTTGDTSFISQTIIDGDQNGSVVTFENGEDSTAILKGFTLANGSGTCVGGVDISYLGGGVYCGYFDPARPMLSDLIIKGNTATRGGGIFCRSNILLNNITVSENHSYPEFYGGDGGGGIYCSDSNPTLRDMTITRNTANFGGGIYSINSNLTLKNTSIAENSAITGGGIYSVNSSASFDTLNRCDIFLNNASVRGSDLYASNTVTIIEVVVDTFTVINPTEHHAFPLSNFTFDILNAKVGQVEADLYISPNGDDEANSGLSPQDPLKTITYALAKILADSLHPHTIHIAEGIYSPSTTGETFPINCKSYVSLSGAGQDNTTLDSDGTGGIFYCYKDNNFLIENMTIQNGLSTSGGGIYFSGSSPNLTNITVKNNSADWGAGLSCYKNSNPTLTNVTIEGNKAKFKGGAIYSSMTSNPILTNSIVRENSSLSPGYYSTGGAISCYRSSIILNNVTFTMNRSHYGGAISCDSNSTASLSNVTITNNIAFSGGGIFCRDNSVINFDVVNHCNVFLNYAGGYGYGGDIYIDNSPMINVIVDTFTVNTPNQYYAHPIDNFAFDIANARLEPISADLYVDPDGDDRNSGILSEEPLKTISFALAKVFADESNPKIIHLSDGLYSPSVNGELYPLFCKSWVSILGAGTNSTVLDAQGESNVLYCYHDDNFSIENLTIQNGNSIEFGGGVYCFDSSPTLRKLNIVNSSAINGGGISCYPNSNPIIANVTISGNSSLSGGAIYCNYNSNPVLINSILWDNSPQEIYFSGWNASNSIFVAYTDVQGGETEILTNNNGTVHWLDGNLEVDPHFFDTQNGDFTLQAMSPCIDAGIAFYVWMGDTLANYSPIDYIGSAPDMGAFEYDPTSSIVTNSILMPEQYSLQQNYSNPFNTVTTISYQLTSSSFVNLSVYNIMGQLVETLVNDNIDPGFHSVKWDASNFSSGVYIYRIRIGEFSATKKCLLLK